MIKNPKSRIYSFFCDCNHSDCTKCLLYIIPFTQLVCFNFIFISINDHRKMLAVINSVWGDCIIATLRFTAHQPPTGGRRLVSVQCFTLFRWQTLSPITTTWTCSNTEFPVKDFPDTSPLLQIHQLRTAMFCCCFFSMSPLLQIVIYCNALWIANGKMANNVLGDIHNPRYGDGGCLQPGKIFV